VPVPTFASGAGPLSPPVFHDERLSDIARLIYWLALVILAPVTVFAPLLIAVSPPDARDIVIAGIALWSMVAVAVVLVRSGRPVGAARVMVVGLWLITTAFVVVTGGLDSPAVPGLLFVVFLAGVLLGWRECAAAAVVVAGTVLTIAYLDAAGLIVSMPQWVTPWIEGGFLCLFAVTIAGLQISSYRNLRRAVEGARQANEGLSLAGKVYDTTSEGIVVTTADATIVDVNAAYERIHGYPRAEVIGQNPRMMKSGKHGPDFYKGMWETLLGTGRWQGEIWDRTADGSLLPKWRSISTIKDEAGTTTHYVGVFSDITTVKQGEEDLEWLATHDPAHPPSQPGTARRSSDHLDGAQPPPGQFAGRVLLRPRPLQRRE
jgi:PAS domain S-box-containing protein